MTKSNYIGGNWVPCDRALRNVNPSDTDDCIGEYALGTAGDVNIAVDAALSAAPAWARFGLQERCNLLDEIGRAIFERRHGLGELLAREEGKTLSEACSEVVRAANIFRFFSGEILRQTGDLLDSVRPGLSISVTREPLGPIGIITPWNFPIAIPAWKIAPALAYGNTVVFKPAELVPGSAHALTEIIAKAGMPAGVFNLVMGRGSEVGAAIVEHKDIAGISFTGSVETGKQIANRAAQRFARLQLEMGGKNPLIVLDDADIDVAVDCAIDGAYFQTGQRCTASSRLVVGESIHDEFQEKMQKRMATLTVDHALKDDTDIGPVVDQVQLDQDLHYIDLGQREGAELVCGGEVVTRNSPGFYLTPALFTATTMAMRINREEIFGPVASIIKATDYEHALAIANDTEFGLASGIVTRSLKFASHYRRNARAGIVMVNLPTAGVDYHAPFGGTKASSFGSREQGTYAREFYTTVKTSYTRP